MCVGRWWKRIEIVETLDYPSPIVGGIEVWIEVATIVNNNRDKVMYHSQTSLCVEPGRQCKGSTGELYNFS